MANKKQILRSAKRIRPVKAVPRNSAAGPVEGDALDLFHPCIAAWFRKTFDRPTSAQRMGWPAIARGENALIAAPTGTGKTLSAFLWCLNRLMFGPPASLPAGSSPLGCRVVYLSPLKALAVDVERNLRDPLRGIAELALAVGYEARIPRIGVRTGDTPQKERGRFRRDPAEILITTPESLYLLLTSNASASLRSVETVIVDEIHALVPTKRGAHLSLSLERLERLTGARIQRIGLSATQRPLEEVARFLGGTESAIGAAGPAANSRPAPVEATEELPPATSAPQPASRPVTIVNVTEPKLLKLHVEVPVEDMARLAQRENADPVSPDPKRTSIWSAIHPRLLEMIRERRSTIVFVNSRRIAERLANAINELAGEQLARAHHGSLAASQRGEIEEQLKAGRLRALVATSSLELGIDMGAVDLVVQIESPPSVASAMQRIGRAGHHVGAASEGIIFPKYRADLIACAAVTRAMHEGLVESTRFPRNPLDVLAQQVVATVAQPPSGKHDLAEGIGFDELFSIVRGAAPFSTLSREAFTGVLDSLAGRYPSDEFSELRPRITWDRIHNRLFAREGSKMLAILNGGTIPDRGLYGVFLFGQEGKPVRVGELDEEMVYESRTGDVFVLGASSWRIMEITHDQVLVSPAPGEPGKAPFWHGDAAGRPIEFGRRIGSLIREMRELPRNAAIGKLIRDHDLDPAAAENLLRFLSDQEAATTLAPDDRTVVIERTRNELGDWHVCVLTPFGSRIHAPWAMAAAARIAATGGPRVETMWVNDGFLLRFPDTELPPAVDSILLSSILNPADVYDLVSHELSGSALFAAKFRENAARALLLPRRRAQGRVPLWLQRKRASGLLSVAAQYPAFPVLLETFRECLRDVFDMPAFVATLQAIASGDLKVHVADTRKPSPFASSLLFSYMINYIYDGDAPLAERRAQALTIDQEQLRDLLGETELRELLDTGAIVETEEHLKGQAPAQRLRSAGAIHDLLLRIGALSREQIAARLANPGLVRSLGSMLRSKQILEVRIAGRKVVIAAEDAARYRDALGIALPRGIPQAFLQPVQSPVLELVRRFARTHGPFTLKELASGLDLEESRAESALHELLLHGRILEGGFRPGGVHREWCDSEVLRNIRQRSLARLRREIEPAEQRTLSRTVTHWQGLVNRRKGLDALLDAIEQLQGAPLTASLLETSTLPARVADYSPTQLDTLIAAGEVVWCGLEPLGQRDGRLALFLPEKAHELLPPLQESGPREMSPRELSILDQLSRSGALFFSQLHEAVGGGYPGETAEALWALVWRSQITNDTFHALRAYTRSRSTGRQTKRQHNMPDFRSRRTTPPAAQGRWSLAPRGAASNTQWSHAIAVQLLRRYGILTRNAVLQENLWGGYGPVYEVLKALEARGSVRRGYFVTGLGGAQFALPPAVEMLRALAQKTPDEPEFLYLPATDPGNLYGAILPWPGEELGAAGNQALRFTRSIGASVILRNGELLAYLRRNNPALHVLLPADRPDRSNAARELGHFLAAIARKEFNSRDGHEGLLIATINGETANLHFLSSYLRDAGFQSGPAGFHLSRAMDSPPATKISVGGPFKPSSRAC